MSQLPVIRVINLDNFELDVDYYLKKEYADIGEAASELPALIEWINEQLQVMIEAREMAKAKIKQYEASAFFDLRDGGFVLDFPGKQTDSAIERAVDLQDGVQEAAENLAVLHGWVSRLTNLLETFRVKFDLIRSTEATRRKYE
jgi:hypothetical protein